MSARVLVFLILLSCPALAQGFAGLGGDAKGFDFPRRSTSIVFPLDHGAHPRFRIEWWYLTVNLKGTDGVDYGAQWTLFRSALAPRSEPGWANSQLWMGHAAITSSDNHFWTERLARGGVGQAGVTVNPFMAWIDDWQLAGNSTPGSDQMSKVDVRATGEVFSFRLSLESTRPPLLHGEAGYSVKSANGQASHYYSQPFYSVTGELLLPTGKVQVTGQGWFDHEWSSQPLAEDQTGWDWFSLHFDTGEKLMGFRLRGSKGDFDSATWISADGTSEPLQPGSLKLTALQTAEVSEREIPVKWRVELKSQDLDITLDALNPNSWNATRFPYWEGPVRIRGSHTGRGYTEMTGY